MKKAVKINMEESDIALLDIQAKEKGISRADLVRDRLFASNGARGYTPQDLAALVSRCNRVSNLPRSEVERSSTQYLLRLCLGLGRQPTLVYKGLNSLLLLKVQGEERMADLGEVRPSIRQLSRSRRKRSSWKRRPVDRPIMEDQQRCKGGYGRNRLCHSFLLHGI